MLTGDLRAQKAVEAADTAAHFPQYQSKFSPARLGFESLDFDLQESQQYISYMNGLSSKAIKTKTACRWLYLCLVGIGAALVAVTISFLLKEVDAFKFQCQQILLEHGYSIWFRYGVWIGTALLLAAIASAVVCFVEPLAAGSGIPEIKCVLNGIDIPNVLRPRTLFCKAFGMVCSVAAGLPCGKEGPMIHSGAIVAAQFTGLSAGIVEKPFRLNTETRDFVAAGAAAGVAAAFGAPVGGVLFAVEEGASHMNPTILLQLFVCAAMAAATVRFFQGPLSGESAWGVFGSEVPVEFGRFTDSDYMVWALPVFALMGICGGLAGALFVALNTRLSQWRMRRIGSRGCVRFIESLLVTFAIVSFNFFAPLWSGESDGMSAFHPAQRLFVEIGGPAIRRLFHTEKHIDQQLLLFFAVVHYVQTIWTYGLGVPSGLFVPSLLSGAAFGRVVGQCLQGTPYIKTQPGVFALIGAAAMMSGMGRITISLAVILIECTGEAEWGVPIFIAVMTAKGVGDLFNKSIYDVHIDLKHVPLLEHWAEKHLFSLEASDCMATTVISLPSTVCVKDLLGNLANCEHHAFPVCEPETMQFIGMVERSTLLHVLLLASKHDVLHKECGTGVSEVVPFDEMIRHDFPSCPSISRVEAALSSKDFTAHLDLIPYTNQGCFTVQEHAVAMRCYILFRTMGLRHLPVLRQDHTVSGMLTRKDLLAAAERRVEMRKDNKTLRRRAKRKSTSETELTAIIGNAGVAEDDKSPLNTPL